VLASGVDLLSQLEALTVRAPQTGIWAVSDAQAAQGRWLNRGDTLGQVVEPGQWQFVGVLPQVATHVFEDQIGQAEIKLLGQEDVVLQAVHTTVLPNENTALPSMALGMAGGGEIAIDQNDPHGTKALEPFFRVQADVLNEGGSALMLHGQVAVMRLDLRAKPMLIQWERRLRQFFQRRFRV
jgi:putative peptide zinc metalloprotease protein